ncbi:MAG: M48 family metalloprotease, partial [Terriglobales bacterium]
FALSLVLLVAIAGLFLAHRRRHRDAVTPNAILGAAADVQRDLSRAPLRWTRLPDESEIRIGDQLARQFRYYEPSDATELAALEKYVNRVGTRVASHAHRRLPYHFHLLIERNVVNAFALPGGHVMVDLGLLRLTGSEDALAFVLGHEVEHIDHYHAVERIQISAQLKNLDLDAMAGLAQIPLDLWQAGYSKAEELEADREGLRLAVAAGYSPRGALDVLGCWAELHREVEAHANTPIDELGQVAVDGLKGYFQSHPLPDERLEQVKKVIAADGLDASRPLSPFAASALLDHTLRYLDGVTIGSRSARKPATTLLWPACHGSNPALDDVRQ